MSIYFMTILYRQYRALEPIVFYLGGLDPRTDIETVEPEAG